MTNDKRLIDANAALEKVCENCCCDFEECKQIGFCVDYENINHLPTVDAMEVVRCKDCKYSEWDCDCSLYLCLHHGCDWNDGEHFCSYGERREGE